MERTSGKERDHIVDLESGGTTSEEEGSKVSGSGARQGRNFLSWVWSGFVGYDGLVKGEETLSVCNSLPHDADGPVEAAELLAEKVEEKKNGFAGKKSGKGNPKKTKKPPKPPRPPRSLILDPADQKLAWEITELAMLKRARIERMKALKKMKASKSATSSNSLCPLIITLLFCIIMILQGVFSRSSSNTKFEVSPMPVEATRGGLISIQYYYRNDSTNSTDDYASGSPSVEEQSNRLGSRAEGKGAPE